jgi:hypothetical protein
MKGSSRTGGKERRFLLRIMYYYHPPIHSFFYSILPSFRIANSTPIAVGLELGTLTTIQNNKILPCGLRFLFFYMRKPIWLLSLIPAEPIFLSELIIMPHCNSSTWLFAALLLLNLPTAFLTV